VTVPSAATLERFIAAVESNRHAEAIEEFYTLDASMQENGTAPRRGRDALVANERRVLARMRWVDSRCVRPVFVNGDLAVVRWIFQFETLEGTRMRMEELAYQRWEGERIAEERFFYDPRQLVPAVAASVEASPVDVVQRQLEAYNRRDLDAFVAQFSDDVRLFRMPTKDPTTSGKAAMRDVYRQRFASPNLHAQILSRMALGNKVIDHERIVGIRDTAIEAVAVYEVVDGLIRTVWFFYPEAT